MFLHMQEAVAAGYRPCKRCRPDQSRRPDEELVHQVTDLIKNRYQQSLSLPVLAGLLHVSPYHLHRIFKRNMGMTLAELVQQVRMANAKQLLLQTDLTITEIALSVGFSNAAHFSTVFQKKSGCTPTHYRNLIENRASGTVASGGSQCRGLIPRLRK